MSSGHMEKFMIMRILPVDRSVWLLIEPTIQASISRTLSFNLNHMTNYLSQHSPMLSSGALPQVFF